MEFKEMVEDLGSEDFMFHYTSLDTFYCHILKNGTLYFSDLTKKNDPHEFMELKDVSTQQSFLLSEWEEVSHKEEVIKSEILKLRPKVRFASFCSNDLKADPSKENHVPRLGCCRMRMWTQYAKNHSGVSIVFSKMKLFESVKRTLGKQEENGVALEPVIIDYVDFWGYKHFSPFNLTDCTKKKPIELAREYYFGKHSPLLIKDTDFCDECETRIIYISDTIEYVSCMDSMIGVVFGIETTESDRNYLNQFKISPSLKKWWITNEHDLPEMVRL